MSAPGVQKLGVLLLAVFCIGVTVASSEETVWGEWTEWSTSSGGGDAKSGDDVQTVVSTSWTEWVVDTSGGDSSSSSSSGSSRKRSGGSSDGSSSSGEWTTWTVVEDSSSSGHLVALQKEIRQQQRQSVWDK
uniref:Secreted protein n=1 Tax=Macrostomum lignano TaxID=282301 RepID=A0A1I8JM75_9PLAT